MAEGQTLQAIVSGFGQLPEGFDRRGVVCVNGHPVARELWGLVRPRPPAVTEVTLHMPPAGGDDGGKQILATIASIGLTVLSGGIAVGGWAKMGSWFLPKSVSAYALAAGVSLAGSLLLSSLVAPPISQSSRSDDRGDAAASGNTLSPNSPIPRVVGERKVFPPLAMEPLTYFDGPDEVVEAAYILAGPHRLRDIRVGAAEVESMSDVEFEMREGWPGDSLISMVTRQARTESLQAELRGHELDEDNRTLESVTGDIGSALPQTQVVSTKDSPDEHQLQITFAQGLGNTSNENTRLRVPVRFRMRPVGGSWVNLPELHFRAGRVGQIRATVRLVWDSEADATLEASTGEGWVEARRRSPGQSEAPSSSPWVADDYFYDGSGDNFMDANNLSTTGLLHTELNRYRATFLLDPAVFPRGRYEIEARRGCAFDNSDYAALGYTYNGSVWDFFGYRGTPGQIAMSREGVVDTLYILRSVSIWNEHPLPSRDLAIVAVRARNRSLDSVSCLAGGWVRDWDGSGWNNWSVTSNPAPHLRDIYAGAENMDPVPADMLENDWLVDWRQHCIDMSYTCNALIEEQTVDDAARIVASCGYAQPYMSDVWGVVTDRDRSGEAPTQLFTPNNMSGFQWNKGFARVPDAFLVNYRDKFSDYESRQILVNRPGLEGGGGRVEQVTYEGLVEEDDVRKKALYDQMQAQARSTFYSWDCAAESIVCRRGSLVAVQHDVLSSWSGYGRVVEIQYNGSGDIVALLLDNSTPFSDLPDMLDSPDLMAEPNLLSLGVRTGVSLSRGGVVTTHPIASVDEGWLEFSPPIDPDGVVVGSVAATGPLGSEYLRLIVFSIIPGDSFTATVTAVDEAPQIWN